jgi:hypothetical protein
MEFAHHQVQRDPTAHQSNKFPDYFLRNKMVRLWFRPNLIIMPPLRLNSAFGTLQPSPVTAAGPSQHSRSRYWALSGPMTFCALWNEASSSTRTGTWLLLVTPPLLGSDTASSHSHSLTHSLGPTLTHWLGTLYDITSDWIFYEIEIISLQSHNNALSPQPS